MRLWHYKLIPHLPRQQLLGQHRECCALRGNAWGKKHSTVDYVFTHPYSYLVQYHWKVMDEMETRGYRPDPKWRNLRYAGKNRPAVMAAFWRGTYLEHDDAYLQECLDNLRRKGVKIDAIL